MKPLPERRNLLLRIRPELYQALADVAEHEDSSLSSVTRRALALGVSALADAQIRPGGDAFRFEAR